MKIARLQGHFADKDTGVALCGAEVTAIGKLRWYQRGYCRVCSEQLLNDYNEAVTELVNAGNGVADELRETQAGVRDLEALWQQMGAILHPGIQCNGVPVERLHLSEQPPLPQPPLSWVHDEAVAEGLAAWNHPRATPSNHASGTAVDLNAARFGGDTWQVEDGVVRGPNGYTPDLTKCDDEDGLPYDDEDDYDPYDDEHCGPGCPVCAKYEDDDEDDLEVDLDAESIVEEDQQLHKVVRAVVRGTVDGQPVEFDVTDQLQAQIKGVSQDAVKLYVGKPEPKVTVLSETMEVQNNQVLHCSVEAEVNGFDQTVNLTAKMQEELFGGEGRRTVRVTTDMLERMVREVYKEAQGWS